MIPRGVLDDMKAELERGTLEGTIATEEDRIQSPRDLLRVVRRRLWVIALTVLAFTVIALGYSLMQPPQYEASSKVLLVVQKVIGDADNPPRPDQVEEAPSSLQSDAQTIDLYTKTAAEALPSQRLAERVIQQRDLSMSANDLLSNLTVEALPETKLIEIGFTHPDPQIAREVANGVAEAASEESLPVDQVGMNSVMAMTWERAETPASPVQPQPARNTLIGLVVGIMVGVGLAFLLEYLDDRLRSPDEAERLSGLPAVGVIPEHGTAKGGTRERLNGWLRSGRLGSRWLRSRWLPAAWSPRDEGAEQGPWIDGAEELLIAASDPAAPATEAYRTLRTALLYAFADSPSTVLVLTGAERDGCQTEVCANLGMVLSQVGKRTVIVDCDFRNPTMGHLFGFRDEPGLAEVLSAYYRLQEVWKEPLPGLTVVPAGSMPYDPAGLLGSEGFAQFVDDLDRTFDYVLLDAPAVGLVPDAAILSAQSAGVLLAVEAHKTPKENVSRAVHVLRGFGANMLGLVVRGVKWPGKRPKRG